MLLSDRMIRELCVKENLISPWSESVSGNGIISYGLTSAGYDLRLGNTFKVFMNHEKIINVVDPKMFGDSEYLESMFDTVKYPNHHRVVMPPHSYILACSMEYIKIPRNIKGRCVGKSTLARCGIIINTTPLEPAWEGFLTIEISNPTPNSVAMYTSEGIAQLEFETIAGEIETSYADKNGKYQNQKNEPVPAKVT